MKTIVRVALAAITVHAGMLRESVAEATTSVRTKSSVHYDAMIGNDRQLFIDDYRIRSMRDVERVVHPGRKNAKPVLQPDKPWEKNATYLYGTVLYDEQDKQFKMWYQTFHMQPPLAYVLYATSEDGVKWEKPSLGVCDWRGSTANNIVMKGEIGTVVKDLRDPVAERRYKMLVFQRPGYHAYFSPDGIRWTPSPRNPVIPEGDVSNVAWDPGLSKFIAITKQPHKEGRSAFLSTSGNFEQWTTPVAVLVPDEMDHALAKAHGAQRTEIYGMPAVPYEGMYIGFPWMFRITGEGAKDTGGDGGIDVQIAGSRDLSQWSRPDRTPVIPRGLAGSFDDAMIFTASAPIIRGDEIWMHYGAWDGPHGTFNRRACIGLAKWRRDGFVSIANGGHRAGDLVTKLVMLEGDTLHVNADFSRPGSSLKAEILDTAMRPLPGLTIDDSMPLSGNSLSAELKWKDEQSLAAHRDKAVYLRFRLLGGDLYSYWVQ